MEDEKRPRMTPKESRKVLGEERKQEEKAEKSQGHGDRLGQRLKRGMGPSKGLLLKKWGTGHEQGPCGIWVGGGEGAGCVFWKKEQGSMPLRSRKCPLGV